MSMYKVGYVPKTIEEYKDNLYWLIMDWANLKEIGGKEYIEFQWLMEALEEAKGVKHSGLIEKAEKETKMTEAKVIGTVIEETNYSNNGTFAMKRKISTNGVEYTIVPLSSGEVLAKNGVLTEEDIATLKTDIKNSLLKHIEKYIECRVIENEELGTIGVRADITVLTDKDFKENES